MTQAQRSFLSSALALGLLSLALAWSLIASADESQLFIRPQLDMGAFTRRLLYGASLLSVVLALKDIRSIRRRHPGMAMASVAVGVAWLAVVVWAILR
ncbi:MAG: hypothetical protein R3B72_15370 [Polyangiaceae bacterium]